MGELRDATLQAEKTLIGTILVFSADSCTDAIDYCKKILKPSDFYDYQETAPDNIHYRIYRAMLQCVAPQKINVAQKMNDLGILFPIDVAYLTECQSIIFDLDYESHSITVLRYSLQRQLKQTNDPIRINEINRELYKLDNKIKVEGVDL
jgi:replicative DNA helicase